MFACSFLCIGLLALHALLSLILGTIPKDSPFVMHAMLVNHYMYGASYPRGGASEIALHMIPVIENAGGRVLVRAPVTRLIVDNGKVTGKYYYVYNFFIS